MPPEIDPDIDPSEVVTPSQAAERFGIPAGTVRSWISRRKIKPLGTIGRYNVYDYRVLARIEYEMNYLPDEAKAAVA
ncbi:helix-turn-helix domain-containing protein [Streptosporangium sp. NPDC051022]|uniref:helix-turn-helix domain-containing protein n=1 Tax=Streptosporangium sp. NPDC051022 TaxID=3155752 RepID=UPI00343A7283